MVELVWKLYGSMIVYHGNILLRTSVREERHSYLALRASVLEMGQAVRLGERNTLL